MCDTGVIYRYSIVREMLRLKITELHHLTFSGLTHEGRMKSSWSPLRMPEILKQHSNALLLMFL